MDAIEKFMLSLKGACGMCGKCCEAIHVPMSPERAKELKSYGGDAKFVAENWIPITKEQAFGINPRLKANEDIFKSRDGLEDPYVNMHFYTCTQLDKDTKLCKVHDSRPYVCSGYPWYGRVPDVRELMYSEDCGYLVDVETAKEREEEYETSRIR